MAASFVAGGLVPQPKTKTKTRTKTHHENRIHITRHSILAALCAAGLSLLPAVTARAGDPLGDALKPYFYPPELLMQTHEVLGLTEDQGNCLRSEFESAKSRVEGLQQQLQAEMEKLVAIVKPSRIDQDAALAQVEKIFGLERELKLTQGKLMILIKNTLTPDQQAQLDEIKRLDPKIKQAKAKVEKAKADGRDVAEIERIGRRSQGAAEARQGQRSRSAARPRVEDPQRRRSSRARSAALRWPATGRCARRRQ